MKFTKSMIDFATTNDASKFVEAVNSILNSKAAETIGSLKQEIAASIIPSGVAEEYNIDDMVRVTNPKATPRYRVIGKSDTHYDLQHGDRKLSLPKKRIHGVMDKAKNQYTQIGEETNEEVDEVEEGYTE